MPRLISNNVNYPTGNHVAEGTDPKCAKPSYQTVGSADNVTHIFGVRSAVSSGVIFDPPVADTIPRGGTTAPVRPHRLRDDGECIGSIA